MTFRQKPARGAAILLTCLLLSAPTWAAVRLPAIISDHMVLQRAAGVPVWGWADPQEKVTVTFGSQEQVTRAAPDGRWMIRLDLSHAPANATTLSVRGEHDGIVVDDVLVGEVWLASGQSNMEKPIGEQRGQKPTFNAEAEIAAADRPDIRLFKVGRGKAAQPGSDVSGKWVRCSPTAVVDSRFSAAAYFFGRRLNEELRVPVGLIDSTVGGTRIELWTPGGAAAQSGAADTSTLYNAMIAGLAPFEFKGVIWYQGESNIMDTDDGLAYTAKMEALVGGWRRHWNARFPFYYVQVAPHLYHELRRARVASPEAAALLREAQAQALRIPGTGMVVTTDLVDDPRDIHPRDKKSVGVRLANVALAETYGRRDIEAFGPSFRALAVDGAKAIVRFDHAQGLAARDGKPLDWFELAGDDGRYYPATAVIEDGQVVVTSSEVPKPVAVRFAWGDAPQPNLVNRTGLPAVPFRSDHPFPLAGSLR